MDGFTATMIAEGVQDATRTIKYQDLICPNCNNPSSSSTGISHAYLEWLVQPVLGKANGVVVMDGEDWEHCDIDQKVVIENVPGKHKDCAHYHCNACEWNWVEDTEQDWK